MPRVLAVIDVDSDGFKVRLDDGRIIRTAHGGETPHIGEELSGAPEQQTTNMQKTAALGPAPESPLPEVTDEERWAQVISGSDRKSPVDSTDETSPLDLAGD